MPTTKQVHLVRSVADGDRTRKEISELTGLTRKMVARVLSQNPEIPRRSTGAPAGDRNPMYRDGRQIEPDGYAVVAAPLGHPHARLLPGRKHGTILEHRLLMEQHLGRYLRPTEVVDHIDGLTLHNAPTNLRLFDSNGDHLRETTGGTGRKWSLQGRENIGARTDRGRVIEPVSTYRLRKERGDVRLRQILLAAFALGIDSPFLSGTKAWLEKAGIAALDRPSLERAWADLSARWEADLLPS